MARFPQLPESPSPADGQTLLYNDNLKRWVPSALPSSVSTWSELGGKPAFIGAGDSQAEARSAIGAAPATHEHDGRYVRTVNGVGPDVAGDVQVEGGGGGAGDWAGLNTVGVGRAVFIPAGGSVPAGTPDYTIIIELAE